ncbi:hypothetical protein CIG75_19120 [Tumebacillus algifaecis]|uniref:Uncharacterized protein n=1 Tax=Tumebacillus algifaecis TaxID=1214604 RepID=A0A223D5L4_9BACL|nr:hypothetical protein [Tumebacillus algifaecis]ASS76845.1 hypothetical protein CIG75_19120 [Tumebacillus algifaecis]
MGKPTTYVDGAGRERCARTGDEVKRCTCTEHDRVERNRLGIPFHEEIPKARDKLELIMPDGEEVEVQVLTVHSTEWWKTTKGLQGVKIDFTFRVLDVQKAGRPKLQLIRGETTT